MLYPLIGCFLFRRFSLHCSAANSERFDLTGHLTGHEKPAPICEGDVLVFSKTRTVEDYNQWLLLKEFLRQKNYLYCGSQYYAEHQEGYHVWFRKSDKEVEVITHSRKIQSDMVKY